MLVKSLDPFVDQQLDLPVRLTQQSLQCDRGFEAAVLQRLEYAADNPPELVHIIAFRCALERLDHTRQGLQMAFRVCSLDPAQKCKLELRPQLGGKGYRVIAAQLAFAFAFGLALRREIQQQQGAFRQ